MSIVVTLPEDKHALLHHLAEENDPLGVICSAIIDTLATATGAALTTNAPADPDTDPAAVGNGVLAARDNHKHHIPAATTSAPGLMAAADKTKLNAVPANLSPALTPATLVIGTDPGQLTGFTVDAYGRITHVDLAS